MPMGTLDNIVVTAVAEHLTNPVRLNAMLQTWLDRSQTAIAERQAELKRLRSRLTQLDSESARVIKLVRNEILSADDPQVATELASIRTQRASTEADISLMKRQLDNGDRQITPAIIAKFGDLLERKLRGADPKIRREYVHLLVDQVEVGDREICITGRKSTLERAVVGSQMAGAVVPKAERKWCARRDSNPRPPD